MRFIDPRFSKPEAHSLVELINQTNRASFEVDELLLETPEVVMHQETGPLTQPNTSIGVRLASQPEDAPVQFTYQRIALAGYIPAAIRYIPDTVTTVDQLYSTLLSRYGIHLSPDRSVVTQGTSVTSGGVEFTVKASAENLVWVGSITLACIDPQLLLLIDEQYEGVEDPDSGGPTDPTDTGEPAPVEGSISVTPLGGEFIYYQNTPSAVWTINHRLNCWPAVTVIDSAGNQVAGALDYPSNDTVVITFGGAMAGRAILR